MKKLKLIFILPILVMVTLSVPFIGFPQDTNDSPDEPDEWRQTTCLLDGSTKCKKTGSGCTTFSGCPGLKEWLKIGPDVIEVVKEIDDAID